MACGCEPPENGSARAVEIRVEDLHKGFRGRPVLSGVDLEIRRGDILALVGGSGAGKTVLMDHIVGLLTPDQGSVWVADHSRPGAPLVDLSRLEEAGMDRVRQHLALVFQKNALFSGTVFQNIALWLKEQTELDSTAIFERVRASLDEVGFEGNDAILTKRRGELSGGMAKRIAVARAIAMRPAIIFYDEPTTGLDPQNAAKVHELICSTREAALRAGATQTTIIITHDKDLLHRLRPRIVMLFQGKVFFDGPYEDFERSDSEIIRPYFELMPILNQATMADE